MEINACNHLIFELLKLGVFLQEVLLLQGEFQLALVLTANLQSLVKFAVKNWQILAAFTVIEKFTTEKNLTSVLSVVGNSFKGKIEIIFSFRDLSKFYHKFPNALWVRCQHQRQLEFFSKQKNFLQKNTKFEKLKNQMITHIELFKPNTSSKPSNIFFF